jgi:PAS domain S-box-containing protein
VFQDLDIRTVVDMRTVKAGHEPPPANLTPVPLNDGDNGDDGQLTWDDDLVWAPGGQDRGRAWRRGRRTLGRRTFGRLREQDVLALLDAGPDAVVAMDTDNRIVFVNRGAESLFGHRRADLFGRSTDGLFAPAARGVLALLRQQVLDGGRPGAGGGAVEVAGVRKDGSGFPAAVWLSRLRTREGYVVAAVIRDVGQGRAAEAREHALIAEAREAREALAAVLRAVSDRMIVVADSDGMITAVNRATERGLGYQETELLGRSTLCLSDGEDVNAVADELGVTVGLDPLLEITRSGLPNTQEWTYVTKDGQRRPVNLQILAVGDRRAPEGFVCVAQDRDLGWQPMSSVQPSTDRLLLELDDAPTRTLRWQVGGAGLARRR